MSVPVSKSDNAPDSDRGSRIEANWTDISLPCCLANDTGGEVFAASQSRAGRVCARWERPPDWQPQIINAETNAKQHIKNEENTLRGMDASLVRRNSGTQRGWSGSCIDPAEESSCIKSLGHGRFIVISPAFAKTSFLRNAKKVNARTQQCRCIWLICVEVSHTSDCELQRRMVDRGGSGPG